MWVCLFVSGISATASLYTNDLFSFGLRHSVITNAEISTGYESDPTVMVHNTAYCYDATNCSGVDQTFGASVHLVDSDFGIFISPQAERVDGASLESVAYGNMNGTNGLIGSVKGKRMAFGEYEMNVDFTPIGATGYVYEVYYRDMLTVSITNNTPTAFFWTGNQEPTAPRINPLWVATNKPAVIVDFKGTTTEFQIEGVRAYTSRIVVKAQTPQTMTSVSRIDVFGRGGLQSFTLQDERVGKFRLYHQALGGVTFGFGPRMLVLSNVNDGATSGAPVGMFTELPRVSEVRAHLMPHTATNDTFKWSFDLVGVALSSPFETYLGGLRLFRENGVLSLSTDSGTGGTVRVYNQGAFVGAAPETNGSLGTLLASNITLFRYKATADSNDTPAYIGIVVSNLVTLSNATGVLLTGDELRVTTGQTNGAVSVLTMLTLTGENLGDVSITRMPYVIAPVEPLRLDIVRVGPLTRVTWPWAPDYYLFGKKDLNAPEWTYVTYGGFFENGRVYRDLAPTNSMLFMNLQHVSANGGLVYTNL